MYDNSNKWSAGQNQLAQNWDLAMSTTCTGRKQTSKVESKWGNDSRKQYKILWENMGVIHYTCEAVTQECGHYMVGGWRKQSYKNRATVCQQVAAAFVVVIVFDGDIFGIGWDFEQQYATVKLK